MNVELFETVIEIDETLISESEQEIRNQIQDFLNKDRREFNLSVSFPSNFTGEVMREIKKIPYGETQTYAEIASSVETAPIAVGQACGRNPLPLIVPCHRVVGINSLGGYLGDKSNAKKELLRLEGVDF